jgi:hypothetical protein
LAGALVRQAASQVLQGPKAHLHPDQRTFL